ncbi:MAG TPA: dUTP diphosphatase [Dehalococcoidia bacterium]|nr:dUTP diphosphatase [Dehalococcoidia bacterium]
MGFNPLYRSALLPTGRLSYAATVTEAVLKVKLLRPGARAPQRATPGSSGLDLYACLDGAGHIELGPDVTLVPTGIAVEAPLGYDLQIRPRSGLARNGVDAILGTLDSDYRGEVFVSLRTFGSRQTYRIEHGDRIAQLVIARVEYVDVLAVVELSESHRGESGHGSTGR